MPKNGPSGTVREVYAYGMTLLSTIHLLDGPYPERDTYQEIRETYRLPGGEAANAAILLSAWGIQVRLDGPDLGSNTSGPLSEFFRNTHIDLSGMRTDPAFDGLEDLVLVDAQSRTVFGRFRRFLFEGPKRWADPDEKALASSSVVLLDPFFGEASRRVTELCRTHGKPYVVIDCPPDSPEHRFSEVTVVSGEFIDREFPLQDRDRLFERYRSSGGGLTVFTSGSGDIRYARTEGEEGRWTPYRVEVKGTLGAGDSFRAGMLYGVLKGWGDREKVSFASAVAACVCRNFPVALHPPSLGEIRSLMDAGTGQNR